MTALVRVVCEVGGEVEHDETVVWEGGELFSLEKGLTVLGVHGTIRVEFDPPLIPQEVPA